MKTIYFNIKRAFFQPVPASTLGYFRIAVSCFALIQVLFLLPDWMLLYGQKGLIPWEISDALSTSNTPSIADFYRLLLPLKVSPDAAVYVVSTLYILSLVGLGLGYKSRIMGVTAWFMHLVINTTGHFTAYGVEMFTQIALFYCMILPVGYSLSFDARRNRKHIPDYLITLSVRLIQIHLCITYLACGVEKGLGEQWWNGEAIWMAMQQDQFHTVNINWMAKMPIVPKLLCWSTLVIETLYPVGIWLKRTKRFWLLSIISMHLFIGIFLGLYLFAGIMILLNLTAFGHHCFAGFRLIYSPSLLPKRSFIHTNVHQMSSAPVNTSLETI